MKKAVLSALIVIAAGYLGCFLDLAGCIMSTVAAATGCIVYSVQDLKK